MSSKSAAAPPEPEQEPSGLAGRLGAAVATRSRKFALGISAAFVGGITATILALAHDAGEKTAKRVLLGPAGAPVGVRVEQPGAFASGHLWAPYYVIPKSRLAGPAAAGSSELAELRQAGWVDQTWAEDHGGMAGSPEVVRFELRGTSDEPVTITAVKAEVIGRTAPVRGWYIAQPAGCGGQTIRLANIDLDATPARVGYFRDDASPETKHLALSVTRTDPEQIELWAFTRKSKVDWRARVFYTGPDGTGSVVVDDRGKPFRVTTERASDGYRGAPVGNVPMTREHAWDKTGITSC